MANTGDPVRFAVGMPTFHPPHADSRGDTASNGRDRPAESGQTVAGQSASTDSPADPEDDRMLAGHRHNFSDASSAYASTARAAGSCGGCLLRTGKDFRDFTLFGNFIELAVAFMVAVVFESLVSAFVSAFITPLIGMLGGDSFENLMFQVNESSFRYGLFVDALLTFLITMAVIFFLVVQPSRTLMRKLSPAQLKRICPFCISNIPPTARVCKFCTREVPPVVNPDKELVHDQDFSAHLEPLG